MYTDLTGGILNAAFKVHTELGPGLLESCYERCPVYELEKRGFEVRRQVPVPLIYDGADMDIHYRLDVLVEKQVVLEIKAVDHLAPIHMAQLLTYLKLCDLNIGLILNFNSVSLKHGIKRVVRDLVE